MTERLQWTLAIIGVIAAWALTKYYTTKRRLKK